MACPETAYIDVRSRVRTEPPGLGSYVPRLYYLPLPLSSNSGLLESSKRDTLHLFCLPDWLQLTTLAGSRWVGALFLLLVGSHPRLQMHMPFQLNLLRRVLVSKTQSF